MAFTGKVLADGQVASSKGTLYTVPGSTVTYVKWLSLHNTNSTAETVIVYAKPGSTSRIIARVVLQANEHARILDGNEVLILEDGDLIEAETTTASKVDFVISGVEEA